MKIACIGGGPAGLYLGILVKRVAPEHDVVVYERNRPTDTFGFGVVFSDATLGHLAAADPETHRQITDRFARWDDIEIHVGGELLRSTGHGFCGIERKTLLHILQARARELGVVVHFEHEVKSLSEVTADVIVACDGVASWVRDTLAAELSPHVDVRPNKFVWLGCTVPYEAFTFLFKQTPYGLFRVHAYRYHEQGSTFIVECREDTWRNAGLADGGGTDEDRTVAILSDVFSAELGGHQLVKNRSIWRNFPTVRCGRWHTGNVVLVGDAAHTAHFSIGSGTKLAMEDSIALRDELLAHRDVPTALAAYEARRRPEVEALQAAAQASLEWFEGTERYMTMAPVQLTYSLMTRSLRVSHASVAKRDPHLARGVEHLLAASVGITAEPPPPPTALPLVLGDRKLATRLAVAPTALVSPDDDQLVALGSAVAEGASVVVTAALPVSAIDHDDAAVAWQRLVDYVHGKGALAAARILTPSPAGGADLVHAQLAAAIERAAFAGFDLLVLDPGNDTAAIEQLPAAVASCALGGSTPRWRSRGPVAAVIHDAPAARATVADYAAQLVRAGATLLWITAASDGNARLAAAPLADRLRNELRVATCIETRSALLPDLDAAIAAGRADFIIAERMPAGARRS
ncbi:MAG TPA: FAD-dependent monooxygenase [Kofleriaceae bacterium]|nr:FAD-dependent monooxygenase [Kofleriaceae bacterium]